MNKTVLIVEDEARMREITKAFFVKSGFQVLEASNGREALEILEDEKIDIVILDIMIPEIDGWTVCRRIRKKLDVPIILLTARTDEDDKLMGYELGADDYMTKPFSPKVLIAKAKNLLMRAEGTLGNNGTNEFIDILGIKINKQSMTVNVDDKRIDLTPKEYDLLIYMIENEKRVLSREQILNNVWGFEYIGDSRVVDNHIKKLRKKLMDKSKYIHTLIKVGYKFEVV
ncbi:MAG: response regulator transcription factor [Maledivibacter sp.]|nr:response regulator transcription factor [Maledivibacter sp.]